MRISLLLSRVISHPVYPVFVFLLLCSAPLSASRKHLKGHLERLLESRVVEQRFGASTVVSRRGFGTVDVFVNGGSLGSREHYLVLLDGEERAIFSRRHETVVATVAVKCWMLLVSRRRLW